MCATRYPSDVPVITDMCNLCRAVPARRESTRLSFVEQYSEGFNCIYLRFDNDELGEEDLSAKGAVGKSILSG